MRRIDVDAHRRVALEQLLCSLGELVRMRCHVLAGNHQPRFFVGERIGAFVGPLLESGGRSGEPAGVFGNRAVLVASLFGADGSQRRAELLGFIGRYCGRGSIGEQCSERRHE